MLYDVTAGKGKLGLLEQDAADDALSAVQEPQQQQPHQKGQQLPAKQPQQRQQLLSNGSSGWDDLHDPQQGKDDAIKSSANDGSSPSHSHKQQQHHQHVRHAPDAPHQLASRGSSEPHRESTAIQGEQQQQQQGCRVDCRSKCLARCAWFRLCSAALVTGGMTCLELMTY